MSLILRDDLSVPISEEMAQRLGLHPGSPVLWEPTLDGGYVLRPTLTRAEAIDQLSGSLKGYLKPGESAVADLIREREEDALREERA